MPPKKQEKSSQSVKVSINLGDKKSTRKPRGKRKPSQKKLPGPLGISPRQQPFSQQPQYIPLYVNQYPSYAGAGSPSYMNAGIPANPTLLSSVAGTSNIPSTAPLLLTNGSATTPTTAMTRMTSNARFNVPSSFYIPTEKPNYPRIDIKKRIEDIQRPKLITQSSEPKDEDFQTVGSQEFNRRRENILKLTGNYQRPTITEFNEETGLPIKSREYGFADRRQEQAFIDLSGMLNLVPPNLPSRGSSISSLTQSIANMSEMQRAMNSFYDDDASSISLQSSYGIDPFYADDADEGFFGSSNSSSSSSMPSLEQIDRIPLARPPPPLSSAPPSYSDVMFYDYLRPELAKLPLEGKVEKENLISTFIPYSYGDEEDSEFQDTREDYVVLNPLFA